MKKSIFFIVLVMLFIMLPAQEQKKEQIPVVPDEQQPQIQAEVQPPVVPAEQPQVQAEAQPPVVPAEQPQVQAVKPSPAAANDMDLKRVRFPQAFIQAGKEYAAGDYWLILTEKEGQPLFSVRNAQKEMLFEELAVVKARGGNGSGHGFLVRKHLMKDGEYFRVQVITGGQWLMGYFLVKK